MDIKNIYDAVIFTSAALTLRDAVQEAIAAKINLRRADLRSADLRSADLRYADLRSADLSSADLSSANLRYANLRSADLSSADLSSANLRYADLRSANLRSADLRSANLRSADLSSADLSSANLSSANLRSANLREIKNSALALARLQFLPTEGQFVGWKKCAGDVIVKLLISAEAKRSHGAERKCRCSEATPISITDVEGKALESAISIHCTNFVYSLGKLAKPDGFDDDRWNVCGQGIHFYLTKEEAIAHA